MKKSLACIVFAVLLLLSMAVVAADVDTVVNIDFKHEGEMNSQMNDLMLYFIENGYSTKKQEYPDFYAGGYITELRDALVICVTDDSDETIDIIKKGTGNPDIRIEKVQYLYSELMSESRNILDNYTKARTFTAADSALPEITSVAVSVKNNGLIVGIKNYTKTYGSSNNQKSISNDMSKFLSDGFANIIYEDSDY